VRIVQKDDNGLFARCSMVQDQSVS